MRLREGLLILISLVVVVSMLSSCSFPYANDNSDETGSIATEDTEIKFKYPVAGPDNELTLYENLNGTRACTEHVDPYHFFPDWLKNLVNEDEYTQWREPLLDGYDWKVWSFYGEGCRFHPEFNVKGFIDHFEITREEFLNAYKNSEQTLYFYNDYDLDLLFDGTAEQVGDYYKDYERVYIFISQEKEYRRLADKIRSNYDTSLLPPSNRGFEGYMVPEMVYVFDISREQLEDFIVEVRAEVRNELFDVDATRKVSNCFNYDFDWLYSEDNPVKFYFDDDPANDISPHELDKMFCRVGEYAE